jgi:flagellar hook-associated protein 3
MITGRVVFNMQRSIRRLMDLQTNMSSGRRINAPSDDPTGTVRDLNYRTELAKIAQYRKNVDQGLTWMGTYDSILSDAKDSLSSAKEIAIAMANGNYDDIAREASATEVQSIFDQIVQLANTELEGRRIFSGFRTRTKPFTVSATGVVYEGDRGEIEFETDSALRSIINFNGADTFLTPFQALGESADVNVGLSADTLLENLNGGTGVDLSTAPASITITDQNLNISSTVDLSGATTVQNVIDTINTQLAADGITNLTVGLGDEGNNLKFFTSQTGQISGSTLLSKLNSGQGVDLSPGELKVSNGAGADVIVDLSGALTVDDVINEFNSQLAAAGVNNVTLGINATQTGFVVTDGNAMPLNLIISEAGDYEHTAGNLGIKGFVGAILTGTDLNPEVSFDIAEAGGTVAADLGILGEFSSDNPGSDLNPLLTADSLLANFRGGLGFDRDEIIIKQGDISVTIDLGDTALVTVQDLLDRLNSSTLDVTASINDSGTGIQIANNDTTKSLTVEDVGAGRSAKTLGIYGSSDLMGSLLVLINALKSDDQEGCGILLENLDESIQQLLNTRGTTGSRAMRLESTRTRLVDQDVSFTKLLSDVEDADMTELITQLSTQENNYQAALMSASKIIQPTLLDFLK